MTSTNDANSAMERKFQGRLSIAVAAAALVFSPIAAFGQAAGEPTAQTDDEMVVTGSRVTNPNLEQASQIQVVAEEEILLQNTTAAEELLRQLPGVVPNIGPAVNNGATGAQTINLRGIGSNRNLVLLDGFRIVPFGLTGVTDLNHIPLALIERVDVVTGGASSVYGADAVSGVVNFVTKRNFEGVDIQSSYRITEEDDGETFRTEMVAGGNFGSGRGNAVVGIGYQDQKRILQGDRPFSEFNISSVTGLPGGSSAAVPTVVAAPGLIGQVDPASGMIGAPADIQLFNFNPQNVFQTPVERFNLFGQGRYDVADRIELYTQAFYTRSSIRSEIASGGTFFNTYALPLNNPFLPDPARRQICGAFEISDADCTAAANAANPEADGYQEVRLGLRRRFIEQGPRTQDIQTDAFQLAAGLRGDLTDAWSWDVSAHYGESQLRNQTGGFSLQSRLQQALRATDQDNCVDPSGGCVPLNLFGPQGSLTPEMINFVSTGSATVTQTSLTQVVGALTGDLGNFRSPMAINPIGVALGVERRRYAASSAGDFLSQTPGELVGAGGADPAVSGSFDVEEFFAEAIVPMVEDRPGIHSLSLELGARASDYSTSGNSTTYKIGSSWEVAPGYKFRAVFQAATRSPNISELFFPVQTGLDNLATDPCAGDEPVNDAALRDICLQQGAPANSIGNIPDPAAGQANVTGGGNPDLDVEEADTFTIGFIFQPDVIPGLTVSFDYFDISVEDAITSPATGDIVDGCFDPAFNPGRAFNAACAAIERSPDDGSLNGSPADVRGILLPLSNLGTINTSGFDFGLAYSWDLVNLGSLSWQFNGTYTLENRFKATPVAEDRDCVGLYSTNCGNIQPELQIGQRLTWSVADYDVSLRHRYLSGVDLEPSANIDGDGDPIFAPQFTSISNFNYFDLTGRAQLTESMQVTATVNNLLDKDPPIVGADVGPTSFNSGNTYPTVYDARGRTFTVGARFMF